MPLMENVFKEFDSVRFNVSSLVVLYAQIQKGYAHITGRKILKIFILEGLVISSKGLTHSLSHWIPQLAIWRAMLILSIDSLVPQTDSFIKSHIRPRKKHRLNQTSCVLSASECMASQSVTLISVNGTLAVAKVNILCYLLRSKNRIQASQFAAKHLTTPYTSVLECTGSV